jgi:hypothetical protein
MRRILLLPAVLIALAACSDASRTPLEVRSASLGKGSTSGAHYMAADDEVVSDARLRAFWDEAGVGQGTVTYTLDFVRTQVLACVNGGDNQPTDKKKHSRASRGSATGTFSPENGRLVAELFSDNVPSAPSLLSCPSGQVATTLSVSYTEVVLTDTNNGVSVGLPDQP